MRVLTTHPITGQPVDGVEIAWGAVKGKTDKSGVAVLKITLGDQESLSDNTIDAKLGDFEQKAEVGNVQTIPDDLTIQLDKPIYQPGQTMHVRILSLGKNGKAKVGITHELKIQNEEGDVEHAASIKTSSFGIAATNWQIPPNARSGTYEINVESLDDDASATHEVTIRPYELPSFQVMARGTRSYYLPGQMATLEVNAQYLFGKPLKAGTVRIIEGNDEGGDQFATGSLSDNGVFRKTFLVHDALAKTESFCDRHFIAFVTDTTTNRTEQKKFDLRISKQPLHLYVVRQESRPDGRRIYVSSFSPDGSALSTDVEVLANNKLVARGRTNRFGIVRLDLGKVTGEIVLRALAPDGRYVVRKDQLMELEQNGLSLATGRAIYRTGETIHCQVGATRENTAIHVLAWNKQGQLVFSLMLSVVKGVASFEIPYQKDFGRELAIAAIAPSMKGLAAATVIFPAPDDLKLRATAARKTYEPGATARLQFQAATQVALGIAVVDQSVMERAATDEAFGRPRWFDTNSSEPRFGDVTYSDLLNMNPSSIDADVELLAEVLAPEPPIVQYSDDNADITREAYRNAMRKTFEPLQKRLDDLYRDTLAYPRDTASYLQMGDPALRDPWLQPYNVRFSIEGPDDLMQICTDGPDKLPGTEDDFCLWQIRRKWFARFQSLIRDALLGLDDYPSTLSGFSHIIDNAGINFAALKDPWHSQMRMQLTYDRDRRVLKVLSAGPDKTYGTADDVLVCAFSGTYFSKAGKTIQKQIDAANRFPATDSELQTLARRAGVDLDTQRDPWGHKYFVVDHTEETYYDKVSFYTYAEYGRSEETRKQFAPSRHKLLVAELRSAGPDGLRGTYDDFPVYNFFRVVDEPAEAGRAAAGKQTTHPLPPGTGMILGTVTDPTGAGLANAKVTLNQEYVTQTDQDGRYYFAGMPIGIYRLDFESPGFQRGQLVNIPAMAGEITTCDFVLQVGSVSETVEVSAPVNPAYTSSAQVSHGQGMASPAFTPRVREYFPETLYWQPELVTDASGRATLDVKLADTITTWHVAVIASTVDGRVSETETSVAAFQPFQVDLDTPPVLTAGDRLTLPIPIRNYSNQQQRVTVNATTGAGLVVEHQPDPTVIVDKESSTNAMIDLRAVEPAGKAKLQVSATAAAFSDAIAKSSVIHPDGERYEKSVTNILSRTQSLRIDVPQTAIAGSVQAEVKVYPTILQRLLEAVAAVLQRPYGCGEQTISSSYPNLLVLRAMQQAGTEDKQIEDKARKNLQLGYERLIGYQSDAGGFEYWHNEQPDAALTAYALQFFKDVKSFIEVDDSRIKKATQWLEKQPGSDSMVNAYSMQALVGSSADEQTLDKLTEMATNAKLDDPYAMAAFAAAAIDASKPEIAESTIRRLTEMAQDEQGAAYWAVRSNTPFHGWGRSGQIETTGMVLSAFAKWRALPLSSPTIALAPLINRGTLFLLRNTDRFGIWGSGQATVRALTALLQVAGKPDDTAEKPVAVAVNGSVVKTLMIRTGRTLTGPIMLDIARFIQPGTNEVSVRSTDSGPVESQLNVAWYSKWSQPPNAKDFTLETKFSNTTVKVNEPVTCTVRVSRPNFRGYGMMIAEVGLPPGVEVDRGSLEATLKQVDSYEVAPDHVTFYVWPQAAGVEFRFQFRPRFAMKAKTAESVLYDYYNPDDRSVLVPRQFVVN